MKCSATTLHNTGIRKDCAQDATHDGACYYHAKLKARLLEPMPGAVMVEAAGKVIWKAKETL